MSTDQKPRATDARFVPLVEPNLVSKAMMRGFADRIRMEGMTYVGVLCNILEGVVEQLELGHAEAMELAIGDVGDVTMSIGRFLGAWADIGKAIQAMDPTYGRALEPARFEAKVRLAMAKVSTYDAATLAEAHSLHNEICVANPVGCAGHEALRRLKERR